MRYAATTILCLYTALSVNTLHAQVEAVSRAEYLAYMTAAAEEGWTDVQPARQRWIDNIDLNYVFGYAPPGNDIYLASLSADLYEITSEAKYLDRARELLLYYGEYRNYYPDDFYLTKAEYAAGLPALPNIFTFGKYVHAYAGLRKAGALTPEDSTIIVDNIAESADYLVNFQEWGPMNRAMLRAEALLYAAKELADHPRVANWRMLGQAIADDNWGQWEIEDATGYHAIWLYSLLGYASHVRGDESLYRTPVMNYYFQYFLSLMSPAGIIPDFGDANWGAAWNRMIPFFEKGAAVYNDPALRWAAASYFRKYLDPMPERKSIFTANTLADALKWADFDLPASPPTTGSQEALEDIVGKKVVFRDGWDPESTFMLYNYRDEGDGGWLFREYLRTTIPVEEEKMHHGHSDENSIVMLMKNGSVLLHDGGYRDFMPSGPFGQFRGDIYHNMLAVRDGKIALGQQEGEYRYASPDQHAVEGQSMLDFFRNSGVYREVRTRKIDFLTLEHYDMTRTRVIDDRKGYEWDRIVNYVKDLDWFVVFDVVRFTEPSYLTMANLWHTRQILDDGFGWYDTAYDSLRNIDVSGPEKLLIYFPYSERLEEGTEPIQRYWQQEHVIYQMIGRHGYRNDLQAFVTVLIPHGADERPEELIEKVQMVDVKSYPEAVALLIEHGGKRYLMGAKLDMEKELFRDWRRPMYDYDSGKTAYGEYETDAYHLYVVEDAESIHYAISGGVKITRGDRVLHEQFPAEFGLNFDGSPDVPGVGKLRYWEESVAR